ncbi:MAG: outer membrane beta-barrel protein [Terracidiphilus sp.]|jgi:opacity protein-like surface antigen
MRTKWGRTLFLLAGLAALAGAQLQAQAVTGAKGHAQTDVSLSLFGAFTGSYNNKIMAPEGVIGTTQSYSNAAGGLLEVRHISKPWFGYEGTYSINRANQTYNDNSGFDPSNACPGACPIATSVWIPVSANAHEVTGDWVASLKVGNLRPFALAGGGVLIEVPSSGQATGTVTEIHPPTFPTTSTTVATTTSAKPVFVYGAGVDWGLLPHIGLRLQYRGNLYKAPDLVSGSASTNALTHTAEPMIGVYFRF